MFSGIVETTSAVVFAEAQAELIRIKIKQPSEFNDLHLGDSVAVNGVCLTLEALEAGLMQFAVGPETQKITEWTASGVLGKAVNLERSLRLGDRIHGHLVTGHADGVGKVSKLQRLSETLMMEVSYPRELAGYIWKKGSVCLNGVSLTVNAVSDLCSAETTLQVGLIPETLRRTNLGELMVGETVTVEVDNMARGLLRNEELSGIQVSTLEQK
jgi:riboflavin synthase